MPTNFDDIVFDARSHTYKCGDKSLMPVTTVLKWLTPEFDSESALASVAFNTGKTRAQIQVEWDAKRDQGLEKGTRVHAYAEGIIADEDMTLFLALNERLHEMKQFDIAWSRLRDKLSTKLFKKEWTIGDMEYGIAGRCDAILQMSVDGNERLSLFDWKTGKYTVRKYARGEMMLPPFDDLPNCEEVKYSMQLSLYRLLIEKNTDIRLHGGYILHLPAESEYVLYNTIDLRDRLDSWLREAIAKGTFGDPDLEKRANKVSASLEQFDHKALAMLSPAARSNLLSKASGLISRGS